MDQTLDFGGSFHWSLRFHLIPPRKHNDSSAECFFLQGTWSIWVNVRVSSHKWWDLQPNQNTWLNQQRSEGQHKWRLDIKTHDNMLIQYYPTQRQNKSDFILISQLIDLNTPTLTVIICTCVHMYLCKYVSMYIICVSIYLYTWWCSPAIFLAAFPFPFRAPVCWQRALSAPQPAVRSPDSTACLRLDTNNPRYIEHIQPGYIATYLDCISNKTCV